MRLWLLPAVIMVTFSSPSWASSVRGELLNQMMLLERAIWLHHEIYKHFPTDIVDPTGKALLSWRVKLLPQLDDNSLFKKFRLDEPWDSEHNLPLAKQTPRIYDHPGYYPRTNGLTFFAMPRGPGTWLNTKPRVNYFTVNFDKVKTILLVELAEDQGLIWSKPGDWTPRPDDPFHGLAAYRQGSPLLGPGGFVACADGTPRFLSSSVPKETFLGMLGPSDSDTAWTMSWADLLTFPCPAGPLLALPLALFLTLWGSYCGWRVLRGKETTPGEWLSLIVAVSQAVFLLNFIRLFPFEWFPPAYPDQHAFALCTLPWLAAFVMAMLAWTAHRKNALWNVFFLALLLALGVIALDGGGGHQFRKPEESLFTISPPWTTGLAALAGMAITLTGASKSSGTNRRWAHWIGLALSLAPMVWFIFWAAKGDAYYYPLFVRIRA